MVGIPRSRACHTCRRRRVQCDLEAPACRRCAKAGKVCEGYESFPVFINRTSQGLQKRHRLDEAKLPPSRPNSEPTRSPPNLTPTSSDDVVSDKASHAPATVDTGSPAQLPSPALIDGQLNNRLLEIYSPLGSHGSDVKSNRCRWLFEVFAISKPSKALKHALRAVTLTRVGFQSGDTVLHSYGKVAYGHALRSLQLDLWSEKQLWDDETLATCRALAMYELYEATSESTRGWHGHEEAMAHFIRVRGVQSYNTPLARSILEDVRYTSMIRCLQYRKPFFLGRAEWRTKPWESCYKPPDQWLYDLGFDIAALFYEIDHRDVTDLTRQLELSDRCFNLQSQLGTWYLGLETMYTEPLFEASQEQDLFQFIDMEVAGMVCLYWALQIYTTAAFDMLCGALQSEVAPKSTRSATSLQQYSEQEMKLRIPSFSPVDNGEPAGLTAATNILRSVGYLLRPEHGLMGPPRAIFPLRVALFHFRVSDGSDADGNLARCYEIFHQLSERNGLGFAKQIQGPLSDKPNVRVS